MRTRVAVLAALAFGGMSPPAEAQTCKGLTGEQCLDRLCFSGVDRITCLDRISAEPSPTEDDWWHWSDTLEYKEFGTAVSLADWTPRNGVPESDCDTLRHTAVQALGGDLGDRRGGVNSLFPSVRFYMSNFDLVKYPELDEIDAFTLWTGAPFRPLDPNKVFHVILRANHNTTGANKRRMMFKSFLHEMGHITGHHHDTSSVTAFDLEDCARRDLTAEETLKFQGADLEGATVSCTKKERTVCHVVTVTRLPPAPPEDADTGEVHFCGQGEVDFNGKRVGLYYCDEYPVVLCYDWLEEDCDEGGGRGSTSSREATGGARLACPPPGPELGNVLAAADPGGGRRGDPRRRSPIRRPARPAAVVASPAQTR